MKEFEFKEFQSRQNHRIPTNKMNKLYEGVDYYV